ncbi:MAG: hypothetical protein MJK15_16020, partial [Colwellia sp.]|nr:hypothetical protein [Colwellia sp.]
MLYSTVHDAVMTSEELNNDLEAIRQWAYQWKMEFNPDPTKQAYEVISSQKESSPIHPPLFFNNNEVSKATEQTHLGLILDSKLTFVNHITEKIKVARKSISLIKHFSKYLPLKTLDQMYKLHVRPNFDYCEVIYHVPALVSH